MAEIDVDTKDSLFLMRLISLVQQNKILYEKTHKFYYNRRKKEKVWKDIAAQINSTAINCKNKWTALREKFIRELKKKQKQSITGAYPEHEWDLFTEMAFLKDVARPRKSTVSIGKVEEIQYHYSPPIEENPLAVTEERTSPPPMKKQSFDKLCDQFGNIINKLDERFDAMQQKNNNSDADELFLRTVVAMIQDLPSSAKDEIKSEIFSKIVEIRKRLRPVS